MLCEYIFRSHKISTEYCLRQKIKTKSSFKLFSNTLQNKRELWKQNSNFPEPCCTASKIINLLLSLILYCD